MKLRIGFIGIVRWELQESMAATLRALRAMGYEGMETGLGSLSALPLPLTDHRTILDDAGIETVAIFVQPGKIEADLDGCLPCFHDLDCRYATIGWGPVESREQLLRDAERYNSLGTRLAQEGVTLLYHNHDHEFEVIDGLYALDILRENTDPQALSFNIDIAWVTFGGADPAEVIRRFAGRSPVLHLKDLRALLPGCEHARGNRRDAVFAEVGTGIVDLVGVVRAVTDVGGVTWADVEQDRLNIAPMETLRVARENIRRAGW